MSNDIKLAVLNGEAINVRKMLLNQTQVSQIWEIYDYNLFTSKRLAEAWGVSIQNASMKLSRFHDGGYLDCRETSAASGGVEYVYSIPKFALGRVSK